MPRDLFRRSKSSTNLLPERGENYERHPIMTGEKREGAHGPTGGTKFHEEGREMMTEKAQAVMRKIRQRRALAEFNQSTLDDVGPVGPKRG